MMLQLVTQYLLQHKKVVIPHVGTVVIEQHSAVLNFADRLIQPPSFTAAIKDDHSLSDHQLSYLAAATNSHLEQVKEELAALGKKLNERISAGNFTWRGLGNVSFNDFVAIEQLQQPVAAEKVVRKNEDHDVLVGDRSLSSHQLKAAPVKRIKRKLKSLTFGWIALVIILLIIVIWLAMNNFSIGASGLRLKP